MGITSARVDMEIPNNGTWEDAFQFGDTDDLTWNLIGQNFRLDVKGNKDDVAALLSLTTANNRIVVDDVTQRVIHLNVDDVTLAAALVPGEYVYDLVMFDNSTPAVRVVLMHGHVKVRQGITGN